RPNTVLLDVREDTEWAAGHAAEARHLGRGIFERDIEKRFPDPKTELIMYCGGGYRSALTCEVAQRMGYQNVFSLAGGYRPRLKAGGPMSKYPRVVWPRAGPPPRRPDRAAAAPGPAQAEEPAAGRHAQFFDSRHRPLLSRATQTRRHPGHCFPRLLF